MNKASLLPAISTDRRAALAEVSKTAATAFSAATLDGANVLAALDAADAIQQMRDMLDDPAIQARIVALQDSPLGFRTDSDPKVWSKKLNGGQGGYPKAYPYPMVRDCALEATLRGLQLVGNQFNIISGRCYATKEGFEFLIKRQVDVSDFRASYGVPQGRTGGSIVECDAIWQQSGKARALKASIPVKSDDYSGADQILGKAARKFLKRCYEVMSGNFVPEGDSEDSDAPAALPAPGGTGEAAAAATTEALRSTAPATAPRTRANPKPAAAAPVVTTSPAAEKTAPADPEPPKAPAPPPQQEAKVEAPPSAADPGPDPLPEETVGQLLDTAGVKLQDFFGWMVTAGWVKDASLFEHVSDVPQDVLKKLIADNCAALRKCLRLYGI